MTHGASEEDLVNSGLEETMIGAYHPIRAEWKERKGRWISALRRYRGDRQGGVSYEQWGSFPRSGRGWSHGSMSNPSRTTTSTSTASFPHPAADLPRVDRGEAELEAGVASGGRA